MMLNVLHLVDNFVFRSALLSPKWCVYLLHCTQNSALEDAARRCKEKSFCCIPPQETREEQLHFWYWFCNNPAWANPMERPQSPARHPKCWKEREREMLYVFALSTLLDTLKHGRSQLNCSICWISTTLPGAAQYQIENVKIWESERSQVWCSKPNWADVLVTPTDLLELK